jgi:HD-like signal output (HDOD) protein
MFAKQSDYKARLTVAPQQILVEFPLSPTFSLPGEAEFPSPPALTHSLFHLELRLADSVCDLQAITRIIRNDVGLTAQLLRLAARTIEESPSKISAVSEIIVEAGAQNVAALVAHTRSLPDRLTRHAGENAAERFWMHARLTALIAEELAGQSSGESSSESSKVSHEEAYLAGLLFRLGDLPSVLGWAAIDSAATNSREIGVRMAKAWGFPRALTDVISGDREICCANGSLALLDIATDADIWATRLESLAEHEYEARR